RWHLPDFKRLNLRQVGGLALAAWWARLHELAEKLAQLIGGIARSLLKSKQAGIVDTKEASQPRQPRIGVVRHRGILTNLVLPWKLKSSFHPGRIGEVQSRTSTLLVAMRLGGERREGRN